MNGTRRGWALVTAQGLLFAVVLLWPDAWGPAFPSSRLAGLILVAWAAVGVAASAWYLGRALTPLPESNGAGLAAHGIYRWIRHPMYVSVLVGAAGVALWRGALAVWVATIALALLFEIKSRYEERHLVLTYEGYAQYAAVTGKYVPGLGKRGR